MGKQKKLTLKNINEQIELLEKNYDILCKYTKNFNDPSVAKSINDVGEHLRKMRESFHKVCEDVKALKKGDLDGFS